MNRVEELTKVGGIVEISADQTQELVNLLKQAASRIKSYEEALEEIANSYENDYPQMQSIAQTALGGQPNE